MPGFYVRFGGRNNNINIISVLGYMSLNDYTRCLAQPPENPFCYYLSVIKVEITFNLLFVFLLALKTVLTVELKKTCPANLARRLRNLPQTQHKA